MSETHPIMYTTTQLKSLTKLLRGGVPSASRIAQQSITEGLHMSGRGTKAWYAVVMLTFVLSLGSAGYQILHPLAVQAWDPVFPQLLQNCFEAYSCEFEWAAGGDASCT